MRCLVSNDDGVHSPGLAALRRAAEAAGFEVWVVAPDREQSATAHSLTLHRPLRVTQEGPRSYMVDGTPTDCVNLAVCSIMRDARPDYVLSGINAGPNLGDDVTYSGTVACAFEGTLLGVPSIAFSLDTWSQEGRTDYAEAEKAAREILLWALANPPQDETLWNVNIPAGVPRGVKPTRMGRRRYGQNVVEKIDPRGRPYYWIGGSLIDTHADGTDLTAVHQGFISVTPLHLDMTNYRALADLEALRERAQGQGNEGG